MLLIELKARTHVVLSEQRKYKYVLYKAIKQETEDLYEEIRKRLSDQNYKSEIYDFLDMVDFFGEVDDVRHYHIKDIIPTVKTHVSKTETIHETMCYQNHKEINKYNNIIIHEDKLSSFKCACELTKLEFFILLKEPKNDATINSGNPTIH